MAGASASTGTGAANGERSGGTSPNADAENSRARCATAGSHPYGCFVAVARSHPCTSSSTVASLAATSAGTVPNGTVTRESGPRVSAASSNRVDAVVYDSTTPATPAALNG